jgi:hypothetical protein
VESDEGGISESKRVRGVVLHDVLARVETLADLQKSVDHALLNGEITEVEKAEVMTLLTQRLSEVKDRGWFPENPQQVMNEIDLIDTDGRIWRPDRVVISDGKVLIVDYKFGEHRPSYVRQVRRYADIWRRMGYENVEAALWYVQTGDVVDV